jgi:hypothetical protein
MGNREPGEELMTAWIRPGFSPQGGERFGSGGLERFETGIPALKNPPLRVLSELLVSQQQGRPVWVSDIVPHLVRFPKTRRSQALRNLS